MEWSDATTLQLIELYEKRRYLYEKVAACNWTITAHATLSRDFVAHSREKVAGDIGLKLIVVPHTSCAGLRSCKISWIHFLARCCIRLLTPLMPAVPNCCCVKGSAPYWSNPPFLPCDCMYCNTQYCCRNSVRLSVSKMHVL